MSKTLGQIYMGYVARLPCSLCNTDGVEVHHIRHGMGMSMSMRNSDFLTLPLCPDCHRGAIGVHGDRTLLDVYKTDEVKLLAKTIGQVILLIKRER